MRTLFPQITAPLNKHPPPRNDWKFTIFGRHLHTLFQENTILFASFYLLKLLKHLTIIHVLATVYLSVNKC